MQFSEDSSVVIHIKDSLSKHKLLVPKHISIQLCQLLLQIIRQIYVFIALKYLDPTRFGWDITFVHVMSLQGQGQKLVLKLSYI